MQNFFLLTSDFLTLTATMPQENDLIQNIRFFPLPYYFYITSLVPLFRFLPVLAYRKKFSYEEPVRTVV